MQAHLTGVLPRAARSAEDQLFDSLEEEAAQPHDQVDVDELVSKARKIVDTIDATAQPHPTAVYRAYNADDQLLYVGISGNILTRIANHLSSSDWRHAISRIDVTWFDNREQAKTQEARTIADENPPNNKARPLGGTADEPMKVRRLRAASLGMLSEAPPQAKQCRSCGRLVTAGKRNCDACRKAQSRKLRGQR